MLCSDEDLDLASFNLFFNSDQISVISCEGNSPLMTPARLSPLSLASLKSKLLVQNPDIEHRRGDKDSPRLKSRRTRCRDLKPLVGSGCRRNAKSWRRAAFLRWLNPRKRPNQWRERSAFIWKAVLPPLFLLIWYRRIDQPVPCCCHIVARLGLSACCSSKPSAFAFPPSDGRLCRSH